MASSKSKAKKRTTISDKISTSFIVKNNIAFNQLSASLPNLSNLQFITFHKCKAISAPAFKKFVTAMKLNRSVIYVAFNETDLSSIDHEDLIDLVVMATSLLTIEIQNWGIPLPFLRAFSHGGLGRTTHISSLKLANVGLTDDRLAVLFGGLCCPVSLVASIVLDSNPITRFDPKFLLVNLINLSLCGTQIGDEAALELIAAANEHETLQNLELQDTPFTCEIPALRENLSISK